jgi:hypothetical protein
MKSPKPEAPQARTAPAVVTIRRSGGADRFKRAATRVEAPSDNEIEEIFEEQ